MAILYNVSGLIVGIDEHGGRTYGQYIKRNNFTQMKYGPMYIYAATMGNTTDTAYWDIIKVHVCMDDVYSHRKSFQFVSCCLKYMDESVAEYQKQPTIALYRPNGPATLSAFHFTCLNPKPGVVPYGIALTVTNYTCGEEHVTYIKPLVPLRESGVKLAISTKVTYGKASAELLIEFVEVYKYLGVDKFISYILEDLNEDTRKVFEYYASTGILDLYFFEPAASGMNFS